MLHIILALASNLQGPTFQATTTYESCQTITMFACGMQHGNQRYGTAFERKECERYTFRPDGTLVAFRMGLTDEGTYRVFAGKVTIELDDQAPFELALSVDGTRLGGLEKLPPK